MARDEISLMRGGPIYRFLAWIGVIRPKLRISRLVASVLVAAALLPPIVSSALQGTLLPGRVAIPLCADYALLGRMLLALPLLVLAAPAVDQLLSATVRQFFRSGFVRKEKQPQFDRTLATAGWLRDSWVPELLCLVVAVVPVATAMHTPELAHLSSWYSGSGRTVSWAGRWSDLVSVPIFRFVALLWLWRFAIWTWLLWRLSRLDPDLRPAHPDQRGGLGFLGTAQLCFSTLSLAGGLVLCGTCINLFVYGGQTLNEMRYLLIGYIVASTVVLLAPLLLMTGPMIAARRHALWRYSTLGYRATRDFDRRWKKGESDGSDSLIDSANPSALADFSSVYDNVKKMAIIPLDRGQAAWMLLAAALPLAPLVFFAMSLDELAKRLASILV